ncbi:MAG: Co2+/Mg2+ efflux protein ApaG [Granulosicoccus sp.]
MLTPSSVWQQPWPSYPEITATIGPMTLETASTLSHSDDIIQVDVETLYVESESDPDKNKFVFAYTVTIRNVGNEAARLLTRHWVIRDANGKIQEVQGDGVVGEQPHLKPGEGFQYTSGTMLETSMGTMGGSYLMVTDDGDEFNAPIADFLLSTPRVLH